MAKAKLNENEEVKSTADVPAEVEEQIVTAEAVEVAEDKVETSSAKGALAKSGKRSAKGIEAAEAKTEKIEKQHHREESDAEAESKPRQPQKPSRSKLERRGKKFREAAKQIEADKQYGLDEAIELAGKTSTVKFDATVELHINLGVDPRHADQNIRDNLVLPAGTGKQVRVAVFADEDAQGADISGIENLTKALDKGEMNFDVLIATPANMPKLGKYARALGPRGLMPNPKSGTVTNDIAKAVQEAKAGRVEYRVDSTGIVHLGIGKVSFTAAQLADNARAVLASIKANKPASVKSNYIKAIHLTTTMGPSITVSTSAE